MPAPDRFAAFILTHGRPDRVLTHRALRDHGYTGPIYLLCDDQDEQLPTYRERYGDEAVLVFDKAEEAARTDTADPGDDHAVVVHARNAVHRVARDLGLQHFIELDDDYDYFAHRWPRIENDRPQLAWAYAHNLDDVIRAHIEFLDTTGAVAVAFAQGGDYIGGAEHGAQVHKGLLRKVMNSFIVNVDRPINFVGRLNEDTTTYVTRGNRGDLFFTFTRFFLNQMNTQSQAGGLTDAYLASGTYVKSFYTVMFNPSSVKLDLMGETSLRVHHRVDWNTTVPKILHPRHRKGSRP